MSSGFRFWKASVMALSLAQYTAGAQKCYLLVIIVLNPFPELKKCGLCLILKLFNVCQMYIFSDFYFLPRELTGGCLKLELYRVNIKLRVNIGIRGHSLLQTVCKDAQDGERENRTTLRNEVMEAVLFNWHFARSALEKKQSS
ncbi:Protein of unknown function [Gryllus bimaculatus]|nr:Protein of unknown function [Gryllus bimaculatus]